MNFYLEPYNWSVGLHQGAWCMFCRQPEDVIATTQEQINAVRGWAESNKKNYQSLAASKPQGE